MKIKTSFVIVLLVTLVSCTTTPLAAPTIPLVTYKSTTTSTIALTPTIESLERTVQCSGLGSPSDFDFPPNAENFRAFTLTYLNKGGNLETLSESLQKLQDKTHKTIGISNHASFDINGDGANDLLIFSTMAEEIEPNNLIWVFECENGQYQSIGKDTWWGSIWYPYEILSTEDLNGDGAQEATILIIGGGSWCHGTYMVIGFENHKAVEYLNLDVDCGTELTIEDNNGQKYLVLTGEKVTNNSQGAASSQKFIHTYRFNNEQRIFYKESETYLP